MTPTDVLNRAADLIARDGLHRDDLWPGARSGYPYRRGISCCPLGAIAVVLAGGNTVKPRPVFTADATHALRERIKAKRGHVNIVRWVEPAGDNASLTEVLQLMRGQS